jgi:MFS family permease
MAISMIGWLLPLFVALIVFGNHYARDAVGALEKQIENNVGLTTAQYGLLNSLFFLPNIITPIIAGALTNRLGAAWCLFYSAVIGATGHLTFALGVQAGNVPLLFLGRVVAGTVYEIIDTVPVVFLGPLFPDHWGVVVSTLKVFLRLGSLFNFLLSPLIYVQYGLKAALWVAAMVASIGVLFAYSSIYMANDFAQSIGASIALCKDVKVSYNDEEEAVTPAAETTGDRPHEAHACLSALMKAVPLHLFGLRFYYYLLAGGFLYGCLVPFWFKGSKFLQENYGLDVTEADHLMLFSEAMIVITAIPLGMLIDRYKWSVETMLHLLAGSCLLFPFSFSVLILAIPSIPFAVLAMGILGVAYAATMGFFWTSITSMVSEELLGVSAGFVAASLNILPSIVPTLVVQIQPLFAKASNGMADTGQLYLEVLSYSALLSSFAAIAAAWTPSTSQLPSVESRGMLMKGDNTSVEKGSNDPKKRYAMVQLTEHVDL